MTLQAVIHSTPGLSEAAPRALAKYQICEAEHAAPYMVALRCFFNHREVLQIQEQRRELYRHAEATICSVRRRP